MSKFINIRQIWHPEGYHPPGSQKAFFQGWFFKLVDREKKNILAVIPGVFLKEKDAVSHAFIQILEGRTHQSFYYSFPLNQFQAARDRLNIRIGDNYFSEQAMRLNLSEDAPEIQGKIEFGQFRPWPVRIFSPGAMGYYAFIPLLQCYHGIISLNHSLRGELKIGADTVTFEGGKGYIEDDWGRSFPEAYIWMQSNHFQEEGTSLAVSVAKIPWLGSHFRGFIIGLLWNGTLYRFSSYNGSQLGGLVLNENQISFTVYNKRYQMDITAVMGSRGNLKGPSDIQIFERVSESLDATISIKLYRKKGSDKKLLYKDEGFPAGAEANGRLEVLLD
ncbi:MAG: hypothetical protein EH225_07595 [Calditrichaeota bacterium]|nr:hypothetical protein [Calditrichota bacterium]RQW03051.1 MAG: hypothetical protein EH225_07595 [Calditrichota bacterium]